MNFTEQIVASPEGGTASLTGDELPVTGYFVGGRISPLVLGNGIHFTPDALFQIDAFIESLRHLGVDYLGWWTDEETGKLYVDATSHFGDYDDAERICVLRGEIAFYDIERQRSFRPARKV